MDIHVVQPGDTLYRIAQQYGVPMSRLLLDNRPPDPNRLAVGQSLVVQHPRETLILRPEETLAQAAQRGGISLRQLLRNNPQLEGGGKRPLRPGAGPLLPAGEGGDPLGGRLRLPGDRPGPPAPDPPFPHHHGPIHLRHHPPGRARPPGRPGPHRRRQIHAGYGPSFTCPLSPRRAPSPTSWPTPSSPTGRCRTAWRPACWRPSSRKGTGGWTWTSSSSTRRDASAYAAFIARMRESLSPLGLPVFVALVPKTSADQRGDLYEGHDYRLLGEAADFVFLMTYEWGYTYGPPMAVAPCAMWSWWWTTP